MPQTISLQIRIDENLLTEFKVHAKSLGFTTSQSYIRYWMQAIAARHDSIHATQAELEAIDFVRLVLAKENRRFSDPQMALNFIRNYIQHCASYDMLRKVGIDISKHRNPRV